ncbi:MAG: protein-methionine-sulfoxide reductase catalytic subunit MsrP [Acidobacteria bacterium]|nr:protein-methionine-sulfoxide reductase catalytic subunit MsrP [Acidobacteriota bacterium]
MSYLKIPKVWEIPEREATPEPVYLNRRKFLAAMGMAAAAQIVSPRLRAADSSLYPAKRNPSYQLDRPLTDEKIVTRYNNFYEFSDQKDQVRQLVGRFQTEPWTIQISGLVNKPQTLDVYKLIRQISLEERLYRHRCVEAWAMAVPWTGFPLKTLIDLAQPKSDAKFVRFVSFYRPDQAPGQKVQTWYPWPYYDSLTMAEATNELAFLVTGLYGHELPKQNGAPIRLVVPWKYGFKSVKSIVSIEFLDYFPPKKNLTFWHDVVPHEYDFSANVDPKVPHPKWSQATERMIDTGEVRPTLPFNGYGSFVAHLYPKP